MRLSVLLQNELDNFKKGCFIYNKSEMDKRIIVNKKENTCVKENKQHNYVCLL